MRKREANEQDHATLYEVINELWNGVVGKEEAEAEAAPKFTQNLNDITETETKRPGIVGASKATDEFGVSHFLRKELHNVDIEEKDHVVKDEGMGKAMAAMQGFLALVAEKRGGLNSATTTAAA